MDEIREASVSQQFVKNGNRRIMMADKDRNIQTWKTMGKTIAQLCYGLRGKLLDFSKREDKQKRDLLMMDLVRRNECNLFAVLILIKASLKNGTTYLKLPVGLLLRSCFADCIMGSYVSLLSKDEAKQFAQTLNEEYVASLFNRAEVYKDKVRDIIPGYEDQLDGWYTMQIEDHFIEYLKQNPDATNFYECSMWEVDKTGKHITLQKMVEALLNNMELRKIGERLYSYYKYFSQYEHFSEASHGDTLVDFGLDNVSFEKAMDALKNGIEIILKKV